MQTDFLTKTPQDSQSEQTHIIMTMNLNGDDALFGGQLMAWIDEVAGITSRRHCGCVTRTAAVEHLNFLAPAYINDILTLKGRVVYVGSTSMEVCVDSYVERMPDSGTKIHVNRALLTMVAIGADGRPATVPRLHISGEEEKQMWADAEQRALRRKAEKNRQKTMGGNEE